MRWPVSSGLTTSSRRLCAAASRPERRPHRVSLLGVGLELGNGLDHGLGAPQARQGLGGIAERLVLDLEGRNASAGFIRRKRLLANFRRRRAGWTVLPERAFRGPGQGSAWSGASTDATPHPPDDPWRSSAPVPLPSRAQPRAPEPAAPCRGSCHNQYFRRN